jgi:hypothetical protein
MSTPLFSDKVAEIFVKVDDFCNHFENEFKKHALLPSSGIKKRNRKNRFNRFGSTHYFDCFSWRTV